MKNKKTFVGIIVGVLLVTLVLSYVITLNFIDEPNTKQNEVNNEEVSLNEDSDKESGKVVLADTLHIPKITPSTRIIYEHYYTLDDKFVREESEPPYYYINLTRQQLEEYLKDWQLVSFSEEKVILRKNIASRELNGYYIIKDFKGSIAVFYDYMKDFENAFAEGIESGKYKKDERKEYLTKFIQENSEKYLKEIIDTPISLLSSAEQQNIKKGIEVYGEEELIRVLENYTS